MTVKYHEVEDTYIKRVPTARHCDGCGEEIKVDTHEHYHCFISYSTGTDYPDNGESEGWRLNDICIACGERLKNLLIANNFQLERVVTEW